MTRGGPGTLRQDSELPSACRASICDASRIVFQICWSVNRFERRRSRFFRRKDRIDREHTHMHSRLMRCVLLLAGIVFASEARAQKAPATANLPWHSREEREAAKELAADRQPSWVIDPEKVYTLPELVDLAE